MAVVVAVRAGSSVVTTAAEDAVVAWEAHRDHAGADTGRTIRTTTSRTAVDRSRWFRVAAVACRAGVSVVVVVSHAVDVTLRASVTTVGSAAATTTPSRTQPPRARRKSTGSDDEQQQHHHHHHDRKKIIIEEKRARANSNNIFARHNMHRALSLEIATLTTSRKQNRPTITPRNRKAHRTDIANTIGRSPWQRCESRGKRRSV